uniref:Uncharacterized protein n=1 Tax=Neobodo designis TaxID=312471 RepID=A0A7S1QUE6_NEODS
MDLSPADSSKPLGYDAGSDKHLRSFYLRPAIQRQVAQARVKAAVAHDERDPWTQLMQRLGPAADSRSSTQPPNTALLKRLCGCLSSQVCAFCASTLSRDSVVSRSGFRQAVGDVLEPRPPTARPSTANQQKAASSRPRSARPVGNVSCAARSPPPTNEPTSSRAGALRKQRFANVAKAQASRASDVAAAETAAQDPAKPRAAPRPVRPAHQPPKAVQRAPELAVPAKPATKRRGQPRTARHSAANATPPPTVDNGSADDDADRAVAESTGIEQSATPNPPVAAIHEPTGLEQRAARVIQAWTRGCLVRSHAAQCQQAAVRVQRHFREWYFSVSRTRAACLLQRISRGCRMRIRLRYMQLRGKLVVRAASALAQFWKEHMAAFAISVTRFDEHSVIIEEAREARATLSNSERNARAVIARCELDARCTASRSALQRECDEAFFSVLSRKAIIVAVSAKLVELERTEDRTRRELDANAVETLLEERHRIERFAVERLEEERARGDLICEAASEAAVLVEAAAMDDLKIIPLAWLRESETLGRLEISSRYAPHVRLHRDEYARVRLAFSESERRKLIEAVEKSERLHFQRQTSRLLERARAQK